MPTLMLGTRGIAILSHRVEEFTAQPSNVNSLKESTFAIYCHQTAVNIFVKIKLSYLYFHSVSYIFRNVTGFDSTDYGA